MTMLQMLHNPLVLKLAAMLVLLVGTIIIGTGIILFLRKKLVAGEEAPAPRVANNETAFALAAYEGVISKLKEQEKELGRLRKVDREQANESASMSESVLSNLSSGVVLFNPANLVRQANPAAKTLLGYQSIAGLHVRDIFRGVTQARITLSSADAGDAATPGIDWSESGPSPLLKAVSSCLKEGALFRRVEADYKTPSGEARVLGITISPVRNYSGDTVGAVALLSDLTEITNLAQQVRLRQSMAALGEMSAGIAHEFKNSLATISGYAQMLRREASAGSEREFAGKIADETASLARIVNDFLQFAKPEGLQRSEVDIRAMLLDCAHETGVGLDAAGLPMELKVEGDPTALRQAFSNLLRNSAEAVEAGVQPRVTAQATVTPSVTTIVLTDNGKGIPTDQIPRVFIPFFTTKPQGTGLGLALVHRIITQHGGTITVASSPSGTGFTIALPVRISAGFAAKSQTEPE